MTNIKKISDLMPNFEKRKKENLAPHEIGDCFGLLVEEGVVGGKYNKGYWFSLLKKSNITHNELKTQLLEKLKETELWLRSKGEKLNKGAWITNRLRELVKTGEKSKPKL